MNLQKLVLPLAAAGITAFAAGPALAADPPFTGPAVKTITATLVNGSGESIGAVQVSQDASGVAQVFVSGSALTAGEHGIHIHAVGKCEGPGFTTAGGHFNTSAHQHGLENPAGPHEGDLTGLVAAANGTYTYLGTTNRISLTGGPNSIFDADGSALVIHADRDDQVTDPTGNSGARVACAVLATPQPATPAPAATPTSKVPLPPNTGSGEISGHGAPGVVQFGSLALIASALLLSAQWVIRRRR